MNKKIIKRITIRFEQAVIEELKLITEEEGLRTRVQTLIFLIKRYIAEKKLKRPPPLERPEEVAAHEAEKAARKAEARKDALKYVQYLYLMKHDRYYHFDYLFDLFKERINQELSVSETIVLLSFLENGGFLKEDEKGFYRIDEAPDEIDK